MPNRAVRRDAADDVALENARAVRRLRGAHARVRAPQDPVVELAVQASRRAERGLLGALRQGQHPDATS